VRPSREAQARGFKISSYLRNADSSTTSNPNSTSKALVAIHGPPTAPLAPLRAEPPLIPIRATSAMTLSMRYVTHLFAPACPRHADALGCVGGYVSLNTELSAEPRAEMSYE